MTGAERIPIGASASKTVEVSKKMTVAHFHPHMPEVYCTPMLVYLMEEAAAEAIQEYLPEGWVSVGAMISVKHMAATPVGFKVTVRAEAVSIKGNLITFSIEAHDGVEKVGEGTQVRPVVHLEQFERRVRLKARRVTENNSL